MTSNESTPTSVSDLPQEIIDAIVDEFFVDTITLRLCSTLCRSFSSRARANLFQTIHLTPNKCSKFETICLCSPEIPSLVKHISFSDFGTNPCRARNVIAAAVNLEQVSLTRCDLLPFARILRELEPARRTSVTHVSIQSWGLRFKEICLLLEQFLSTDILDLEGQTLKALESKAFVETFTGGPGLPIRRLDLRISQELNPFIDCFRSVGKLAIPFSVSRLRYLSVDFVRCWDLPQLDALLKETSHTLEELQFICCDYPCKRLKSLLRLISHARNRSLEDCHVTDEHISSAASLLQFEIRSDRAQCNRFFRVSHRALVAAQSCCYRRCLPYRTRRDFDRTLRIQYGVFEHGDVVKV